MTPEQALAHPSSLEDAPTTRILRSADLDSVPPPPSSQTTVALPSRRLSSVVGLAPAGSALARLSRAERAVLDGMLGGQTNEAIARARGTSVHTVGNQVASIFKKLGVSSRAELAAHADLSPGGVQEPLGVDTDGSIVDSLVGRERVVAELVTAGLSNAAIAKALGCSVSTVALALSRACGKFGVTRRVELIRRYRGVMQKRSA